MYKSFLLVAHGNILSYYCLKKNKWRCHYKFDKAV